MPLFGSYGLTTPPRLRPKVAHGHDQHNLPFSLIRWRGRRLHARTHTTYTVEPLMASANTPLPSLQPIISAFLFPAVRLYFGPGSIEDAELQTSGTFPLPPFRTWVPLPACFGGQLLTMFVRRALFPSPPLPRFALLLPKNPRISFFKKSP